MSLVMCGWIFLSGCGSSSAIVRQPQPLTYEGPLPSAKEVFARHLEATGGEQAWSAKQSCTTLGTIEVISARVRGSMRSVAVAPDRVFVESTIPGVGVTAQGFDGTMGWTQDPVRGFARMDDRQIAQIRRDGRFLKDLDLARNPGTARVVGRFEFEGQPCWRITMDGPTGAPMDSYYSVDTGLLVGMTMMAAVLGAPDAHVNLSVGDYRLFGDVMVAARSTTRVLGQSQVMTISTVQWNTATEADIRSPLSAGVSTQEEKPAAEAPPQMATGTCFAVRPDGWLVTASHVVEDGDEVEVKLGDVAVPATVVARDRESDVALIKVDVPTPNYVPIARDSDIQIGRRVYTLGYPAVGFLSQDVRFTEGTISSVRAFDQRDDLFQISVPLQPGNSGGALIDESGVVLGVVVGKASARTFLREVGSLPENISFAVDSDRVLPLLKVAGVEAHDGSPTSPSAAARATFLVISRSKGKAQR